MKKILLIIFVLLNMGCDEDNPVKSENRNPEILSVIVFPEIVKPSDSLIVICNATDPDGDTLVYDWYTSGSSIRIKGGDPRLPVLFNTYENSQIFYAPDSHFVAVTQDSFKIICAARDGKGGQVSKAIYFKVK